MDWQFLGTPAGAHAAPDTLPTQGWAPARVPGTVAEALGLDVHHPVELEDRDWWYRVRLPVHGGPHELVFEGLAGHCEAFLGGQSLLASANMHRSWRVAVELDQERELVLVFRSLKATLAGRQPRPRWKTALVDEQKLRLVRTSLAGRVPGWTPLFPAIGPWRPVRLVPPDAAKSPPPARGAPWWPHTHGAPGPGRPRLDWTLGDEVALRVNGVEVFCRGACWAYSDALGIEAPVDQLRARLQRAVDAGLNMIRVGGTGVYASEALLALCDELGVMVWQDLMFANMDYPFDDEAFRDEVTAEVVEVLQRLARHRCAVMVCGGSEVEQQAAMMGLPPGERAHPWFSEVLPELVAEHAPGLGCLPSTPWGGELPFSTDTGVTHYFGVGAYRRPLSDARLSRVQFAAECLGLSNLPSQDEVEALSGGASLPTHDPAWKRGVPRDRGTGWDFEDIRDHYLREHFGVDPVALRSVDLPRYLDLSRALTGELMLRTYAEWRRPDSPCSGALIWLFQDLLPGAGCGILDHRGQGKPVLRALARAWAPRAVLITDEGLNGLDLHVHNESPEPLRARVELELLRGGRQRTGFAELELELAPHSSRSLRGEGLMASFMDLSCAYRFGPPRHELVVARLLVGEDLIHQDVFFPVGMSLASHDAELSAEVAPQPDGSVELSLSCPRFLQALSLRARGWEPDDDFLHLVPGRPRRVRLRPREERPFKCSIQALNWERTLTVRA
jgi:beta-mannosidase